MAIHWKMIIVLMYENPLSQADLINRLRKLILSCNFPIVSDGVRIRFWFEVSAWKYINIRFVNHLHLLIQWIFSLLVLLQILVHRMTRPISMVCICFQNNTQFSSIHFCIMVCRLSCLHSFYARRGSNCYFIFI